MFANFLDKKKGQTDILRSGKLLTGECRIFSQSNNVTNIIHSFNHIDGVRTKNRSNWLTLVGDMIKKGKWGFQPLKYFYRDITGKYWYTNFKGRKSYFNP